MATLGRVHSVHPFVGELYYLCILLHHKKSRAKVSWENVHKVNGIQYDTFQATYRHLGLLHDNAEWNTVLEDAALISMCPKCVNFLSLCYCFVTQHSLPFCLNDTTCKWGTISSTRYKHGVAQNPLMLN